VDDDQRDRQEEHPRKARNAMYSVLEVVEKVTDLLIILAGHVGSLI
jgi:hypothetical protein